MTETVVNLPIGEAIVRLKNLLNEKGVQLIDERSDGVTVKQGSIWGIFPTSSKKVVSFDLSTLKEGQTRIASRSNLSRDYIWFTIFGCAVTVAVMVVCLWISFDLGAVVLDHTSLFGGIISSNIEALKLLSDVTLFFAGFLALTLGLEAVVVINVRRKIWIFAHKILSAL